MIGPDSGGRVNFLYTNIGRGHPHYLDGIIEQLDGQHLGQVAEVFALASGASLGAWKVIRLLYRTAGSHRAVAYLYNRLRAHADYSRLGIGFPVLAGPLRRRFLSDGTPLVVAHPLLVAALRDKPGLLYQHGEVAAPRESLVRGQHGVFVPTTHAADEFMAAGFAPAQILVSELCIEPGLVAQAETAFETRLRRISGSEPLCGAFLPSGAEPRLHVARLVAAAVAVAKRGGRAFLFAAEAGRFAAHAVAKFSEARVRLRQVRSVQAIHDRTQSCVLCIFRNRCDLNELTSEVFPEFDYFVSAAHERTSWALGLGLPVFVVDPSLGSFAPDNRELLLKLGVGQAIRSMSEAAQIGRLIERLRRSGRLARMAESGWGRFGIEGFGNIARVLSGL